MPEVTLRYVGGMRVMLTFPSHSKANSFLQNEMELWSTWFTDLGLWEGKKFSYERVVKIQDLKVGA
ncbi:hypothetical protein HanIR_Chr17g0883201 [Helianthus annuus]|nr:hypothetical protein HanIR_Chr17g0883201 [Helianthus annuus]